VTTDLTDDLDDVRANLFCHLLELLVVETLEVGR
jgi:hypothetical protein